MLKLYENCELMLTVNNDIRKGKANGTTMKLSKIILKSGAKISETTIKGKIVNNILGASQVKHIITKTNNSKSKIFKLEAENMSFQAQIPLTVKFRNNLAMKKKNQAITIQAIQFQVVSNNATTG